MFYFQGGGACWDEASTKLGLCTSDVSPQKLVGVFDRTRTDNKYRDYTIVHVSYCSGDVHGGDIVQPYNDKAGKPVTQKGVANAQSAVDWVKSQVSQGLLAKSFSELVVMGCSAGSIGAQIWARQVLSQLSWQTAAVVPDSYAGIFPDGTMGPLIYSFGFCNTELAYDDIKAQCDAKTLTLQDIDRATMNAVKSVPFSFIQSKTDIVQQSFYVSVGLSMGVNASITPAQFYADVNDVFGTYNQQHNNFLTYLVDGDQHCFTPSSTVYYAATGAGPNGATNKGKSSPAAIAAVAAIAAADRRLVRVAVHGVQTTDQMLYQWTNTFPLAEAAAQTTQCDGAVQAAASNVKYAGQLAGDTTYCSSSVVPKTYTEHY